MAYTRTSIWDNPNPLTLRTKRSIWDVVRGKQRVRTRVKGSEVIRYKARGKKRRR